MDNERIQWAARMLALLEPLKSRLTPGGSGFALHYDGLQARLLFGVPVA